MARTWRHHTDKNYKGNRQSISDRHLQELRRFWIHEMDGWPLRWWVPPMPAVPSANTTFNVDVCIEF